MANIKQIINANLDIIELLEDEAKAKIDLLFDKINMAELIKNPDKYIDGLISEVLLIIASYSEPVIQESERFVEHVSNKNEETS